MRFTTVSAMLLAVSLVVGCQDQKPKDQIPTAVQTPDTAGMNEATPLPEPGPMTYTPPAAESAAPVGGAGTYTVKPGDTLWKISTQQLGDGKRWKDIVQANPGLEPTKLKVGQIIKIPGK